MPRMLVRHVEVVVRPDESRLEHPHVYIGMSLFDSSLRAVESDVLGTEPHRHTGVALVAVRAVGEQPAAAKALLH